LHRQNYNTEAHKKEALYLLKAQDTIKKNPEPLLDASKEVGLEVNPEKTGYMLVSRSQKTGQSVAYR
jgi:hypothetical protein